MVVDTFFLVDLPLRFFIGVIDKGNLITSIEEVSRQYLKNTFVLNCLASIPVGWIEFFAVPDVDCETAENSNSAVKYLRIIRLIRMIRILKVVPMTYHTFHMHSIDPQFCSKECFSSPGSNSDCGLCRS